MFNVVGTVKGEYSKNIILTYEDEISICDCISEKNKNLIEDLIKKREFTGKSGEKLEVSFYENEFLITMVFLGVGKREEFNEEKYRVMLYNFLSGEKGKLLMSSKNEELLDENLICNVLYNVNYNFDIFKEEKGKKLNLDIYKEKELSNLEEIISINEITNRIKELIDLPANILTPSKFAEKALNLGNEYGIEVEIFDEKDIEKMGMNLLLNVGKSSINPPRVVVMRYLGDKKSDEKIGLVGKGLTFDAGGLCLKSSTGMFEKCDMAGAATVLGAILCVAKNEIKKNVVAVMPLCENLISDRSYKPGDIIKAMNGKYIEIINTDAEGRLALADAITYIKEREKVSEIVDAATLTGAMAVALGTKVTAVFSNNDKMFELFEKASKKYGEQIWRMPLYDVYKESLKSEVADFKNTGERYGGGVSAAKFLEIFSGDTPWMHLDLTTAFDSGIKWMKKGASGIGTKPLYEYIKNR